MFEVVLAAAVFWVMIVLMVFRNKPLDNVSKVVLVSMMALVLFLFYLLAYDHGRGNIPPMDSRSNTLKTGELYVTQSTAFNPVEGQGYIVVLSSESGWIVRRFDKKPPDSFVVTSDGEYAPVSPKDYRRFKNLLK